MSWMSAPRAAAAARRAAPVTLGPCVAAGCLNGGGQLRPRPGQTQQQLIAALDDAYHSSDILPHMPQVPPFCSAVMQPRNPAGMLCVGHNSSQL